MLRIKKVAITMLCVLATLLISCGKSDSGARNTPSREHSADRGVVNLYIWANYLAPDTIASFEKLTGVRVDVSYFDSPEALESRMLTGSSGFDVVVPTAAFIQRHIQSGAYLSLDKQKLPNLANLDPGGNQGPGKLTRNCLHLGNVRYWLQREVGGTGAAKRSSH